MFKQLLKLTYQNNISLLYFQHLYAVHKVQIDSAKFQENYVRQLYAFAGCKKWKAD